MWHVQISSLGQSRSRERVCICYRFSTEKRGHEAVNVHLLPSDRTRLGNAPRTGPFYVGAGVLLIPNAEPARIDDHAVGNLSGQSLSGIHRDATERFASHRRGSNVGEEFLHRILRYDRAA